jgi:hypothetical protein
MGVIADMNVLKFNQVQRSFTDEMNTHYNPELGFASLENIILKKSDSLVFYEPNYPISNGHQIVKYPSMDQLRQVFYKEGLDGLKNYTFLVPVYITDDGDLFGNPDISSDGKVNGVLRFNSILNNTSSRKSPSCNILLFDGAKKNIGYITYCAEKDYGSDNSMFYIPGKEARPFSINVTARYFGGNEKNYKGIVHEPGEILYYSFFSDNSYCQIGGYTKYIDLTIEEITGGEVNFDNKEIDEKLKMNELILYLPYLLIGLVALIGNGLLLNSLYKRMHARTSILSYIPMTNLYIAVKLAFGKKIAWGFYLLCILSLFIAYSSSSMTFTYILIVLVMETKT